MSAVSVFNTETCAAAYCGKERPSKVRAWATFAAVIVGLLLFIYVIGPAGLETKTLKPMADFIEANDINANAYYYTDVEEFFSAERHMREHLKLVPGANR